eukprot:CAMPEP_0203747916 /NCGR_PEP_ID=MMETSP0098-20131031/2931_1 /ASSEMBLY_ACC=CAM_ASM_000208 /TAXON_ID=96639 /ORGANISM=" , Strain NY0313808BC1" /LENGTH=541 /DNA_ID=CAMNT_0050636497 /DNA_START=648 /DNA_END=2270 /DNA_ORIENTATION=+
MSISRHLRVVSLLPSATEALCFIGGGDLLVGRSHECDYPAGLGNIPVLTSQRTRFTTPKDVDDQVRTALNEGLSLYSVDEEKLASLRPDVIITQSLCAVCSIDVAQVVELSKRLKPQPKIVSLNPHTLQEVLDSLVVVGESVGLENEAKRAKAQLQTRIDKVLDKLASVNKVKKKPNCAFIEWTDPIYIGGHWTPEMISMVGGVQGVNPNPGSKSFAISHNTLVDDDPDCIIVCPCGLDLEKTEDLMKDFERTSWWKDMRAVVNGSVCLVDGNQMFNRPGPRLVDCLEWLVDWMYLDKKAGTTSTEALRSFPWKPYYPSPSDESLQSANMEQLEIEQAHRSAMEKGLKMYIDPKTGYSVFTEQAGIDRGYCCGKGCRHCPFGHWNVDPGLRKMKPASKILKTTLLRHGLATKASRRKNPVEKLQVLFWSGGKDSYMTLLSLRKDLASAGDSGTRIVLLNTFHSETNIVQEQNIALGDVLDQGQALKLDMIVVPLPASCPNTTYQSSIRDALVTLTKEYDLSGTNSLELVFGDLHLKEIKDW